MQNTKELKQAIMSDLPKMMETDPEIREFILRITREMYADKQTTESRFDRIMQELKRDREEQNQKWEENQKATNSMLESIEALSKKHDSSIGALGARWGLQSETAFRNGLKSILEKSFNLRVERYEDFDYQGNIFGRPDQVEMDIIISNGILILCEIKSSMSKSDMYTFWRKKDFYEQKHGVKATRYMVISPMLDPQAKRVADELGIETYSYPDSVKFS